MNKQLNPDITDELCRIHAYTRLLGQLCELSPQPEPISPETLEQIFNDIANVTKAAHTSMVTLEKKLNEQSAVNEYIDPYDLPMQNSTIGDDVLCHGTDMTVRELYHSLLKSTMVGRRRLLTQLAENINNTSMTTEQSQD